ncbi:MAG: nucleotidyltransferase family protein [Acidobacteriia bacterium]|nr:nucleotidyltransferase family protein [Terriglobia bacterium]
MTNIGLTIKNASTAYKVLLSWFEAHGCPTLVLKGMALTLLHYRDMALRPMSDLDILVPEDRAPEVVGLVQRDG